MSYDEHLISMAGGDGDVLDQIQRRARIIQRCMDAAPNDSYDMSDIGSALDAASDDVPALLALVREQQARIERVQAEADSFDELASDASYFGTEATMEAWLSAATRIRAILGPKP